MQKKHYLLSFLLLVGLVTSCPVQADDFGLWTGAGMSQKLGNSGFSADADLGLRLNNNWKSVDRWNFGVGLSYDLTSFLEAGVGYDYLYSYSHSVAEDKYNSSGNWRGYNVDNGFWRSKNRLHVDLKGKLAVGRFGFSLRERYQLTGYNHVYYRQEKYRFNTLQYASGNTSYVLRDGYPESEQDMKRSKTKNYLRSRLSAEYNIPKCPVDPYAAFEVSNNLANGFSIDKRRYTVGFDWKLKKGHHLSLAYVYSNGNDDDDDDDIHAISVSYKVKNLFWSPKKKKK